MTAAPRHLEAYADAAQVCVCGHVTAAHDLDRRGHRTACSVTVTVDAVPHRCACVTFTADEVDR